MTIASLSNADDRTGRSQMEINPGSKADVQVFGIRIHQMFVGLAQYC
jgi:hypothetical protein